MAKLGLYQNINKKKNSLLTQNIPIFCWSLSDITLTLQHQVNIGPISRQHPELRKNETRTYVLGNCIGAAPLLWNTPSTKTPFFPLHTMKKHGLSKYISKCLLEIKLECPIFTSTSPRLLFRPMLILCCRIMYSNSRPSNLAIAAALGSGLQTIFVGLDGADLSDSRAQASLSFVAAPAIFCKQRV